MHFGIWNIFNIVILETRIMIFRCNKEDIYLVLAYDNTKHILIRSH